ncbi:MAG: type II toxin-antitoxin system RelE/ParE family toxin [Terriglobia bacterium]
MDFKVLFSDQALSDLSGIIEYVAQRDPEAALRVGRSLLDHVKILKTFPGAGTLVSKRPRIRKLFHTPYKIYYRIDTSRKVVEILHFWHGARNEPGI